MQEPIYVLKDNEALWLPKKGSKGLMIVKKGVWIILGLVILLSVVFRENLFKEMTWTTRLLLIALFAGTFFIGGQEKVPSPFELRFYDDHLVLFREKLYYSKRLTRRTIDKFYYKDIKKIEYRSRSHRIGIDGIEEILYWDYRKDGTLPPDPTLHNTGDCFAYFYTDFIQSGDIIRIIEQHCPIKVTINTM